MSAHSDYAAMLGGLDAACSKVVDLPLSGQAVEEAVEVEDKSHQDEMEELLDGVDLLVAEDVRYLFSVMEKYRIRPWLSDDGLVAGVHCAKVAGWDSSEVLAAFRGVFFGENHATICCLLEERLKRQGQVYAVKSARELAKFDQQPAFAGAEAWSFNQ